MSMRATFTTEFIYDGAPGYGERKEMMVDILTSGQAYKPEQPKGGSMIGQIFGVTAGSDLSESDIKDYIEDMVLDLSKITHVPFKVAWLFEGGDVLIKEITPAESKKDAVQ